MKHPSISVAYLDSDGSLYLFGHYGQNVPWPDDWPDRIGDAVTFCRERGIYCRWG